MVAGHLQEKRGYWYMVLNLHDADGKRKPKWIPTHLPVKGGRSRAEELLYETRRKYSDKGSGYGLLFSDYMRQWLEQIKSRVSPNTYKGYRLLVENSICPYFQERSITLRGLRAADLQKYYDSLLARGVTGNTAIHHHANIHKALEDAVRLEMVDRNVADIVERPKKQQFIPHYYSAEEANELLDRLQGHWLRLPVLLAVFYGLRRSEVAGLQWRSVDFTTGTLHIQHTRIKQEQNGKTVFIGRDTVKQRSSCRTLPMPEAMQKILRDEAARQYGDSAPPPEAYVCVDAVGKPISPDYFSQCFRSFLRKEGLREIRLHDLRHTCASLLIQDRTPLIEVQQWLGHSTLAITADLYAHLEYDSKLASAETLKKF